MERPISADSMWIKNNTIKNKLNINNQKELDKYIKNNLPNITINNFTKDDFLKLHYNLFNDIYEFAGKLRDENLSFNNFMLCKYQVIDLCLTNLFETIQDIPCKTKKDVSKLISYIYSELFIIYPFRDGNEISIEIFLNNFIKKYNYQINFKDIDQVKLKEALIHSVFEDISKLNELLLKYIK